MLCTHCSSTIKPVVAIDIDGTLANYHFYFLRFAQAWLGMPDDEASLKYDGSRPLNEFLGVNIDTYRTIKLAFRQGAMKRSMPAFPDASWFTWHCSNMGAEVWITTTRPYLRMDNIDPDTREWMNRNDIYCDFLFYDDDKYAELLKRVDAERVVCVIDDEAEQIDKATKLGLRTVWRRSHYNAKAVAPTLTLPGALGLQARSLREAALHIDAFIDRWSGHE